MTAGAGPAVSVAIPTFEGGATLGAAIDSVLAQDFTDFELIVVDDGSSHDVAAIVAARADRRLRLVRHARNLGARAAWNRGLAEARGPLFKLLPHDDLLLPGCLARQAAALAHDPAAVFAFGPRQVIGGDGRVLARRGWRGPAGPVPAARLVAACVRAGTNVIGEPAAVLARRDALQRAGGFDDREPYVIDLDAWFRLLALGPAQHVAEPLCAFRVSAASWSVAIGRRQGAEFSAFVRRVLPQWPGATTPVDRLAGRVMPGLNTLARLAFYRWHGVRGDTRHAAPTGR